MFYHPIIKPVYPIGPGNHPDAVSVAVLQRQILHLIGNHLHSADIVLDVLHRPDFQLGTPVHAAELTPVPGAISRCPNEEAVAFSGRPVGRLLIIDVHQSVLLKLFAPQSSSWLLPPRPHLHGRGDEAYRG